MADILRQIYYSIYIYIYIYYGRYITTDILHTTYIYIYITADILWQICRYYDRYVMADISRQIYYGRYDVAEMLRQIYYGIILPNYLVRGKPKPPGTSPEPPGIPGTPWARPWDPPRTLLGPQKRKCLCKSKAPGALDCCVRTCLLGPIAPRTPPDSFI